MYKFSDEYTANASEIADYDDLLKRVAEWSKLTSPQFSGSNGNAEIVKSGGSNSSPFDPVFGSTDITNNTFNINGTNGKDIAAEISKTLSQQAERKNASRGLITRFKR